MHDFQEQCQVRGQRSKNGFYNKKIRMASIIKQLLDSVFVISGIIKVEVSVISRSRRLRLITLTETLIIPDITKTESNNCFIIPCFKENNDKRIIAAITVYFQTLLSVHLTLLLEITHCAVSQN